MPDEKSNNGPPDGGSGQRPPKAKAVFADSDSGARFRSQPEELLQVRGLRYSHPDGLPVFQDLDLTVSQGETVVIMGGSGEAKPPWPRIFQGLL